MRTSVLLASMVLVGCAESAASVTQVGGDGGAQDVTGAPPDAGPEAGAESHPDVIPSAADLGSIYPAVCAYTGKFCTGALGDANCIPRQDPRPAAWDWGPQEAETRIINCDVKPLDLGKFGNPEVSPAGYIVTQLAPTGGTPCVDDLVIQPGQACYMRARFDLPACIGGPCKYEIPSWSIMFNATWVVYFGPIP